MLGLVLARRRENMKAVGVSWRFVLLCMLSFGCSDESTPRSAGAGGGGESGEATGGVGADASGAGSDMGGVGSDPAGAGGALGGDGGSAGVVGCGDTLGGADEPIFDQTNHLFQVRPYPEFVSFDGAVFDGPPLSFHEEAERAGSCRLLTYEPSLCDPACEDGQACLGGECVSHPAVVSAGVVELRVGPAVVELEPNIVSFPAGDKFVGHYYWSTEEFGAEAVGPTLAVSASGADAPAFDLETCVSEAPVPTEDWSSLMEARAPGEDVVLDWSNPVATARIYLRMTTGIGTHGGISPVEIECEGRDTGTLTLPGAYLDALYADGWSCGECGGNEVLRYHATETEAGTSTIQLRAEAGASFYFLP
jgi:hypothetical protein